MEDYLVQLAWANQPASRIGNSELTIAKEETKQASLKWTEQFRVVADVNQVNLSYWLYKDDFSRNGQNVFIPQPLWSVQASLNLGDVFVRPSTVKAAREKEKIAQEEIHISKLEIREKVLSAYQNYQLKKELVPVRIKAEEDAYQAYVFSTERFKDGKMKFEEYNQASLAYSQAQEARITAAADVKLAKTALEAMIGVSYEEAEKYAQRRMTPGSEQQGN